MSLSDDQDEYDGNDKYYCSPSASDDNWKFGMALVIVIALAAIYVGSAPKPPPNPLLMDDDLYNRIEREINR